jgi:nucleotide-binding universal stress UspA family protein
MSKSPDSALATAVAEAADQGVDAITHELEDDPADALLDVAEKNDAAIIVVSGKGMRADDRHRFGNVADKLSHNGTRSVLIVGATDVGDANGDAISGAAAGSAEQMGEDARM